MRIQETQKLTDPTDPETEHCLPVPPDSTAAFVLEALVAVGAGNSLIHHMFHAEAMALHHPTQK